MMQQNLPKIMNKNGADDFQTPPSALNALLPYLDKEKVIWECASGKGNLVKALIEKGYVVFDSDIKQNPELNFLTFNISSAEIIVTNPPFSLKNQFIERCYELGKPFALLLPLAALETAKRQAQWRKGLQLIVLKNRLHFETPNNKKSNCWFASAWFTHGLNLPSDLNFEV